MSEQYRPFVAPKLKLARARMHLAELRERMDIFNGSNPFNIYINTYLDRNPDFLFGMIRPVPPDVSLVYGDVVHCLRAALDILACDVVRANDKSADDVAFPFASSGDALEAQIKRKKFDRASPDAVNLLKQFKPYPDGNDNLRALHDLDILDKHRMVLPTYPMLFIPKMIVDWGPGSGVVFENVTLGPDLRFGIPSIPRRVVFDVAPSLRTVLDVTAPKVLRGKPLFETLEHLHQLVASIIEAFESLLTSGNADPPLISPVTRDTPLNDRPKIIVRDLDGSPFFLRVVTERMREEGIVSLNSFRFTPQTEEFYGEPIAD